MAPASLKRKLLSNATSKKKKTRRTKKTVTKKRKQNVKRETKPMVASLPAPKAENNVNLKAKVEYSPNAMAKCQSCRRKIQKQHKRFGIPEHSARYNKEIYRYYHVRCCPPALQARVPNAMEELKRQKAAAHDKERIVAERQELYQELKHMRLMFANRLEVPAFMVLSNATLEEIVFRMPTTNAELLKVHGIGPSKLQNFGDPIRTLIQQYRQRTLAGSIRKKEKKPSIAASARRQRTRPGNSTIPLVIAIDDSDDDDDDGDDGGGDIAVGKTLTCEQLVNQKFAHAAANGYVISVD